MINDKTLFQYCQKLVIFSKDGTEVLLCKRKGEEDFDGIFSFPGGKMEVSDNSLENGLKREKNEELGENCKIKMFLDYTSNEFYVKKNGLSMVLPHYFGLYEGGEITLNHEYSEFKWVKISELKDFEPKINTIEGAVAKLLKIKKIQKDSKNYINI